MSNAGFDNGSPSPTGRSVLSFIERNFTLLSSLSRLVLQQGDTLIPDEILREHLSASGADMDLFLKYRIFRRVDEGFEMRRAVVEVIAFANREFAIRSPESIRKFHASFLELYNKLQASTSANDIILYGDRLIAEIGELDEALDGSASRLLQDTLNLRDRSKEMGASERFRQADKIIREYAEPLKEIVADHSGSILWMLRDIKQLTLVKGDSIDGHITEKMRRLRFRADRSHGKVVGYSRKVISELMALQAIRKSSATVAAAVGWLRNGGLSSSMVGIATSLLPRPHDKEFFFGALDILSDLQLVSRDNQPPMPDEIDRYDDDGPSMFHCDVEEYARRLTGEIPVSNAYRRIYEDMTRLGSGATYENYCSMLSVLRWFNWEIESDDREAIDFVDFYLDAPMIVLTESLIEDIEDSGKRNITKESEDGI